jgi:hypothetical protein
LKGIWITIVAPTNQEIMGPLRIKEYQGVVEYLTSTPKGIPKGGHTVVQVHILLEIIRHLKWMN